jgi:hypothetical protein
VPPRNRICYGCRCLADLCIHSSHHSQPISSTSSSLLSSSEYMGGSSDHALRHITAMESSLVTSTPRSRLRRASARSGFAGGADRVSHRSRRRRRRRGAVNHPESLTRPDSSSFTGSISRYRGSWTIQNITDWLVSMGRSVCLPCADHAASVQDAESQTNDERRGENRGMAHPVCRSHTGWVREHAERRIRPRSYYRQVDPFPPSHPLTDDEFEQAFIERPTVLYFHGNVRLLQFS